MSDKTYSLKIDGQDAEITPLSISAEELIANLAKGSDKKPPCDMVWFGEYHDEHSAREKLAKIIDKNKTIISRFHGEVPSDYQGAVDQYLDYDTTKNQKILDDYDKNKIKLPAKTVQYLEESVAVVKQAEVSVLKSIADYTNSFTPSLDEPEVRQDFIDTQQNLFKTIKTDKIPYTCADISEEQRKDLDFSLRMAEKITDIARNDKEYAEYKKHEVEIKDSTIKLRNEVMADATVKGVLADKETSKTHKIQIGLIGKAHFIDTDDKIGNLVTDIKDKAAAKGKNVKVASVDIVAVDKETLTKFGEVALGGKNGADFTVFVEAKRFSEATRDIKEIPFEQSKNAQSEFKDIPNKPKSASNDIKANPIAEAYQKYLDIKASTPAPNIAPQELVKEIAANNARDRSPNC